MTVDEIGEKEGRRGAAVRMDAESRWCREWGSSAGDATDQPGNLRHEALYGHRASRASSGAAAAAAVWAKSKIGVRK